MLHLLEIYQMEYRLYEFNICGSVHHALMCEISPTRCNNCVFYSQWLYSTCFGDNLTHHQEYNAVYGQR